MVFREQESLTDSDPHSLLFGHDDDTDQADHGAYAPRPSRRDVRANHRRLRRHRRTFAAITALVVVLVVAASFGAYRLYEDRYHPKDYSGQGVGSVDVVVHPGDGASAIGSTLVSKGVVASARAFVKAADANSAASGISAGTYRMRKHMSAKAAVALMLDPSAKLSKSVVVFDGATTLDVVGPLAKAINVSPADVDAALKDVKDLNLPSGYTTSGAEPASVEGFLYPATYTFDPGTSAQDAVEEMISNFINQDRSSDFAAKAQAVHLSAYQALIIASIAEKEAKVAADYPKVARVILNRIAAHMPLQIDATSAYAAKLAHLDPTKVIYAHIDSPYNTYTHDGLPPTPIANPGATALDAAVAPASGNWLYYVNSDANGDLFFTSDEHQFELAVERCRANHWGCG